MIANEPEISIIAQDYDDKKKDFPKVVKSLRDNDDVDDSRIEKKNLRTRRAEQLTATDDRSGQPAQSATESLYQKLSKNARSIIRYGNGTFPVASWDSDNNVSPELPNFTKALYNNHKSLGAYLIDPTQKYGDLTIRPCVVSHGEGETSTEFSKRKPHDKGLEGMESTEFTRKDVDICDGPHESCSDCIDCGPHHEELLKSLQGFVNPSSSTDGMRTMHAKNIISTLESWAAHHDTKGGTKKTENNSKFAECNHNHQSTATHLRLIALRLREALQSDGAPHRDNFYGNNQEEH